MGIEVEQFFHLPFASGVFLEAPDFATAPIGGVVGAFHGGVVFAPIDA